jgi:MATE family multidrug resistance protein
MVLNLLGLALKVPLNWMFIFGHWGAPELGATGCALSTALANWIICLLAWLHCGLAARYRSHRVFARWSWPRWREQLRLLALGMPIGGSFLVDVTAFTFMALFVARLGAVNSAAHQIAANVAAVMYMLPLSVGSAVGVLVGQAIGGRELARARSTGLIGIALGLGLAFASAATLATGAPAVAAFYSNDVNVQTIAASLLVLVAGYHLFDALQAVTINALRGYKRAMVPLIVNVIGLWLVGLAGGYAIGLTDALHLPGLGLDTPLGVRGFWIAATIGMGVASGCILLYFLLVSALRPARAKTEAASGATH